MSRKKVLIVDDEELSREIILFELQDRYDCDTAADPFEAYEKMLQAIDNDAPYDLVTIDEFMGGGMDGLAFLKIIRISEKFAPRMKGIRINCVIISGIESETYLKRMYEATIRDGAVYFKKPFKGGELLESVNILFLG